MFFPSSLGFVESSPGVLTLADGIAEDYVFAESSPGVFELVAKADYTPDTTRLDAVRVGDTARLY